jgi:hypothetical protein
MPDNIATGADSLVDPDELDRLAMLASYTPEWYGRSVAPVAATPTGGSTYAFANPTLGFSRISRFWIYGGSSGGTVKLQYFAKNGDVFTRDSDVLELTVVANQLNDFTDLLDEDISADGNRHLGVYVPNNVGRYTPLVRADSGGWYYGTGDVSTFTDAELSPESRLEWGIEVEEYRITQLIPQVLNGPAATGYETIVTDFTNEGTTKAEIGFQDVDDQDPQAGFMRVYSGLHESWFDLTTYQYGGTIKGWGTNGHTIELQLASDDDLSKNPEFSVRHRVGGADRGARAQVRNGHDTVGFGLNFQIDADPHLWLEDQADTPATLGIYHPQSTGAIVSKIGGSEIHRIHLGGLVTTVAEASGSADSVAHEFVFGATPHARIGQLGSASSDAGGGFIEISDATNDRTLRLSSTTISGAIGNLFSSSGAASNQCYFKFGSTGESNPVFTFTDNGCALGAILQVVNGDSSNSIFVDYSDANFPNIGLRNNAPAAKFALCNPRSDGAVVIKAGANETVTFPAVGGLGVKASSAEPEDPADGNMSIWLSDGTGGAGDEGDVMVKITVGGVTKTATLVDFSAI